MDTAVGAISIARDKLATMLSKCKYWQTFDGRSYTESQALARIYQDTMPLEDVLTAQNLRPFAVIHKGQSGVRWRCGSHPRLFITSGQLIIEFHRNPATINPDDPGQSERAYENEIGLIICSGDAANPGLVELSALDTNLCLVEVSEDGPYRTAPEDIATVGDSHLYYVTVDWGVGS